MSRATRVALGALVSLAVLGGLRTTSYLPYTAARDTAAVVRLAWRARGERVNQCRTRSADELARLPVHMRQAQVCERRLLPYRLVVDLDDREVANREVRGAGAREDRPLFVFEDIRAGQGRHRLVIHFTREGGDSLSAQAPIQGLSTPPRLALDTVVALYPRRIILVTYDEEREQLVLRDRSPL
ncbi:MAG TPA: hypothetical protein VMH88_11195 [Gemmatimonadales bacterium]|nr:hypothetical protein [Gemmatimonadales bacterium]